MTQIPSRTQLTSMLHNDPAAGSSWLQAKTCGDATIAIEHDSFCHGRRTVIDFMRTLSLQTIACLLFGALSVGLGDCQQPTDLLAQARSLLSSGKLSDSEASLRSYLITDPSSAEAHFLLGYVLFREQKPKDSLAEFTAGAKFRRPHADEFRIVASDYIALSDFGDADKWFSAQYQPTASAVATLELRRSKEHRRESR